MAKKKAKATKSTVTKEDKLKALKADAEKVVGEMNGLLERKNELSQQVAQIDERLQQLGVRSIEINAQTKVLNEVS